MPTGFLLINLGTPSSPSTRDVRRYLDEFLMDPYVIDSPWLIRRLLVSAFILPFRPKKSAEAYASIWTDAGSPLLVQSQELRRELDAKLNDPVTLGMRYGEPSIETAMRALVERGAERIVAVPLYPQFADSTVTTSIEEVRRQLPEGTALDILPPFYAAPPMIESWRRVIADALPDEFDHVLFSYHGLPERHITRADPTQSHCLQSPDCCENSSRAHATCYRHQVFATSTLLARALGLETDAYSVSFQSRLGRLPWLTPYTDQVLAELPARGVKRLVVACPAFVVDNLETLEEIGMRGRETFLAAGGESLTLTPCLNAAPHWVDALAQLLEPYTTAANADTSA